MAQFRILVIPSARLSNEYKYGNIDRFSSNHIVESHESSQLLAPSVLTQVEWYRLIVDEGHTMGGNSSNIVRVGSWIRARCRWGMTGTPQPQVMTQSMPSLRNFLHLINYLNVFRGLKLENGGDRIWLKYVSQYWNQSNILN